MYDRIHYKKKKNTKKKTVKNDCYLICLWWGLLSLTYEGDQWFLKDSQIQMLEIKMQKKLKTTTTKCQDLGTRGAMKSERKHKQQLQYSMLNDLRKNFLVPQRMQPCLQRRKANSLALRCIHWCSLYQAVGVWVDLMPQWILLHLQVPLWKKQALLPWHPLSTAAPQPVLCPAFLFWTYYISTPFLKPWSFLINPGRLLIQIHFLPKTKNKNPLVTTPFVAWR